MSAAPPLPSQPAQNIPEPQVEEQKQASEAQSNEQIIESGAADNMIPSGSMIPSELQNQDISTGLARFESVKESHNEETKQNADPLDFLNQLGIESQQ